MCPAPPERVLSFAIPQAGLRVLPVGTYAAELVASPNGQTYDLGTITITHAPPVAPPFVRY